MRLAPSAALAITAITLTGCASLPGSTAAAGASTGTSAAPSSPAPSCRGRFITWRDGGGKTGLDAVLTDLGSLSKALTALQGDLGSGADPSSSEASVQQAAASLQSDSQTAQADLPPSCVPGLRGSISAGLTDYSRAAIDCDGAVTEISSGNSTIATSDIYAASSAIRAGDGKVQKATAAIQAFSAG